MRKTITPVISVVLLVMLTIVASGTAFLFISNIGSDLQGNVDTEDNPVSDTSILRLVSITGTKAIIKNEGSSPINEISVFVNGELINYTLDAPLDAGEVLEITYDSQTAGEDLDLKIIYNDGKSVSKTSPADVNTEDSGFVESGVVVEETNEPDESLAFCLANDSSNIWFSGTITGSNGPCCGDDNTEVFNNGTRSCGNGNYYSLKSGFINISESYLIINGRSSDDNTGIGIGGGDFNNDGYNDFLIGGSWADTRSSDAGETYVIFGENNLNGTIGVINANTSYYGIYYHGYMGVSVGSGDFNNDNIDDILIGSYNSYPAYPSSKGETYVIFGSNDFTTGVNYVDTVRNMTINGTTSDDRSGLSVIGGDFNNDGIDDIVIGGPYADPYGFSSAGQAYIIFGSESLPETLLTSEANVTLNGGSLVGSPFAKGDVNGDNIDDLLIGASNRVYVMYGSTSLATELNLTTDSNVSIAGGGCYGDCSVASGDVNNDGYDDIIIGADHADSVGTDNGMAYVYYGSSNLNKTIESTDANITFNGLVSGDQLGTGVSSGDYNGDGIKDILLGAAYADPNGASSGQSYLIFGSSSLSSGTFDLLNSNITFNGSLPYENCGRIIFSMDFNNDGIDEIIFSTPTFNSYVGIMHVMNTTNLI